MSASRKPARSIPNGGWPARERFPRPVRRDYRGLFYYQVGKSDCYTGGAVTDMYVSADVETDGPIPGRYSMLAFGLAVAGTFDGTTFRRHDPAAATFYRELRPISGEWLPQAVEASGL